MNIILLSGGSGKRLWPLSNGVRAKQFLKIFINGSIRESMLQRMYRFLKASDENINITIAASESQIPQIRYQIEDDDINISIEPCRKDTFPAIALACAQLKKNGVSGEEPIIVCPVDSYVDEHYFECLKQLSEMALVHNLALIGIKPQSPSTKYGYITKNGKFIEKPYREKAIELIENGAYWNAGVFAFKLDYVLEKAADLYGFSEYDKLYENYQELEAVSFDYAVSEHENDIAVIVYSDLWDDLGTWDSLTKVMNDPISGDAGMYDCEGTHIINELNIPLIAIGAKNLVIAATPDGILVSDKAQSNKVKDYVTDARPMHEARPWGHYTVLDRLIHNDGKNSLTKHLVILPEKHISYQRHKNRMEMWTFIEGKGELIINGKVKSVTRGDSVVIPVGTLHAIKAVDSELHIIEVQIGDKLVEEDIERFDWNW